MNTAKSAANISINHDFHHDRFIDVMHEMDRIHGDVASPEAGFEDSNHNFPDVFNNSTPKPLSAASPSSSTPSSTRTRHCSSNSNKSSASLDSAIADLSWAHTPKASSDADFSPDKKPVGRERADSMFTDALFPSLETPQLSSQQANRQLSEMLRQSNGLQSQANGGLPLDVKSVCDYLYISFCSSFRTMPKTPMMNSSGDALFVAVHFLSDSMSRMRHFLMNLDPALWLCASDRWKLYSSHLCAVAVVKASMWVDLATMPSAYPLPAGEFLSEINALHLIMAHDLYNEMRCILSELQALQTRATLTSRPEAWPVWLLVVMITFFTPHKDTTQQQNIVKIHDYFTHKLQTYLAYRFGATEGNLLLMSLVALLEKVRSFCRRFREFLRDVESNGGFSKQHKSVCENVGLIAFLLQTERANF